jgi:prolipoprotein diacylglyceryltransferase
MLSGSPAARFSGRGDQLGRDAANEWPLRAGHRPGAIVGRGHRRAIGEVCLGQRIDVELPLEDVAKTAVLARDLRPRAGCAEDRNEHRVGLFAQRVPRQQSLRRVAGTLQIAVHQPLPGRDGERILEGVRQPLALGGEAVVAESLDQVAGVDRNRSFGVRRSCPAGGLEPGDVEIDPRAAPQPEQVRLDLEHLVGVDAGRSEARPNKPQGLAKAACRSPGRVGPEIDGDPVARPRPRVDGQEGEQCLRLPAAEPHGRAMGDDLDPAEEMDRQRVAGRSSSGHRTPSVRTAARRRSQRRVDAVTGIGPPADPVSPRRPIPPIGQRVTGFWQPNPALAAEPRTAALSASRHTSRRAASGLARKAVRYTAATVPLAVIALDFEPVVRYGDNAVRLETLALAAAILTALVLAAAIATRTRVGGPGASDPAAHLRLDDMVLLVLAIVPGAVAGGRLGYALLHLDYYAAHPAAVLDPGQGSLELGLAVVGGALTGIYAARLIGERVGRWLDVAALPLLVAIGLGKVAMALGGRGQGAPSDAPWATSYVGDRAWASLAPAIPSHPSQVYETIATLVVLIGVGVVLWRRPFAQDGLAFLVALGGWALVRAVIAATWRDAPVVGPLLAEQLLSLAIVAGCLVARTRLTKRSFAIPFGRPAAEPGVSWRRASDAQDRDSGGSR